MEFVVLIMVKKIFINRIYFFNHDRHNKFLLTTESPNNVLNFDTTRFLQHVNIL